MGWGITSWLILYKIKENQRKANTDGNTYVKTVKTQGMKQDGSDHVTEVKKQEEVGCGNAVFGRLRTF